MKRIALALILALCPGIAWAQCTGIFPPGTYCGNNSGSPAPPSPVTINTTGILGPGSSTINGLPLWVNGVGTQLKDGAGQTIAGNYAWAGTQTYNAAATFNAAVNFVSTFQINGVIFTWPALGTTVAGLGTNQTFTGNNIFAGNNTFNGTNSFNIGNTTINGNLFTQSGGLQIGSPTGGDKGVGGLNAVAVYQNGVQDIVCSPLRAGDLAYWNGSTWTCLAGNNSGTNVLTETAAGVPSWQPTGGGSVTSVVCNGVTINGTGACPPAYGFSNCSISASVASNNLTVNLLDNAGATPSAASPCNIYYRNATSGTGSWTQVTTTAAVTFTANANSTFGVTNTSATCRAASSCPFKLWVVAINSGSGTVLGVVDLTNASGVQPLNEGTLLTTTACSACASATALGTTYSTSAQTTKPFVILGYLEWGSGLAAAGSYASAPTAIQTIGPGIRRPGETIQRIACCVGSVSTIGATGTTFAAGNNTNITASITPTMASNPIKLSWTTGGQGAAAQIGHCQLSDTSGPTAVGSAGAGTTPTGGATWPFTLAGSGYDTPGVTTAKTYTVRCWTNVSTFTVPDVNTSGAGEFLEEVMG